jgi:hypothetical protein
VPFLGYDPATNPLNTTEWAFPACEIFHILGFALLIGTIFIVDLRLMGLGMKSQTPAELVKATAPWTLAGLVLILITGPAIFSSDPALYVYNQSFRYKISALLIAIIFNWTLHRRVAMKPEPGGFGVIVGAFSALLWTSIIGAGIFIAFV